MRKFAPVIVFILLLSQSCSSGITRNEVWQNEKIDPKVKAAIAELDKQVYNYMSDNNYEALSKLFTDSLLDQVNTSFAQKFMPQIQKVIKGHKYTVFGQYYARNVKAIDTINISSAGKNGYSIKLLSANNETFVSMLVAGSQINEVMLTIVYSKVNGKWKINNLLGEDYSLNRKNAQEQYTYAQELQKNGHLIDAINVMSLANYCIRPGGSHFKYNNTEEIAKYNDSLTIITKAKYPFPYTVSELATKPLVFNIHYEKYDSSLAPMIMYQSSVDVSDTVKLKVENETMQKSIGSIFSGMDKNNPVILYRAYNVLPDGKNDPRYYGYIQKVKS